MHLKRERTSWEREPFAPFPQMIVIMLIIQGEFQGLVLWVKLGSISVLIKYLPAKQLKCWLRSQCEVWASIVCAPGSLTLCRFNAHSTVVLPQSPLNSWEEREENHQVRSIKGCHSLLSVPLTLSPHLNCEQQKPIVWENCLKYFSCSLVEAACGLRRYGDSLKQLYQFWVYIYMSISISAVWCASLSSGTWPLTVDKTKHKESKVTHFLTSKIVFRQRRGCQQRSVLIHLNMIRQDFSFYIPLTGVSKSVPNLHQLLEVLLFLQIKYKHVTLQTTRSSYSRQPYWAEKSYKAHIRCQVNACGLKCEYGISLALGNKYLVY